MTTSISKRIAATVAIAVFIAAGLISLLAKRTIAPQQARQNSSPVQTADRPTNILQSTSASETSTTYLNSRYGYEVTIPPGWRIATRLMRAVQPPSFLATYTPEKSDIFIITELDALSETSIADGIEKVTSDGKLLNTENATTSGKIMTLTVSGFEVEPVEAFQTAATPTLSQAPEKLRRVQLVQLQNGVIGERYHTPDVLNSDVDWTGVDVPYIGRATDRWGDPVRSVEIKTRVDQNFSEGRFASFYLSFSFVK